MAVTWKQTRGNTEVLCRSVLPYLTPILGIHVSPSDRASPIHAVQHDLVIPKVFAALTHDLKHGASYVETVPRDIQFFLTVDMILPQRSTQSLKSYIRLSRRNSG